MSRGGLSHHDSFCIIVEECYDNHLQERDHHKLNNVDRLKKKIKTKNKPFHLQYHYIRVYISIRHIHSIQPHCTHNPHYFSSTPTPKTVHSTSSQPELSSQQVQAYRPKAKAPANRPAAAAGTALRATAAPVEGTAVCDEVPLAEAPVDEAAPVAPEVPEVLEPVAVPVELVLVPVMVIKVLVVEVPVVVPEVEALEEVLEVLVLEVEELWAEPVTLNCSDWARIPVFMVSSDWRLIW
jgi:hypothetical protein